MFVKLILVVLATKLEIGVCLIPEKDYSGLSYLGLQATFETSTTLSVKSSNGLVCAQNKAIKDIEWPSEN